MALLKQTLLLPQMQEVVHTPEILGIAERKYELPSSRSGAKPSPRSLAPSPSGRGLG
ncbi:MAG: hypothetical protein LH660_08190 [Phormidesmis sp. CAN_BIN36]|nr:hypothetical protein [Phormidesmis sp. CAN_BIN36]